VFAFQFNEMGLYCHSHSSSVETSDSIRTKKSTPERESVDGNRKSAGVIFSGLSVTNRDQWNCVSLRRPAARRIFAACGRDTVHNLIVLIS
jgi:hypothetical protein